MMHDVQIGPIAKADLEKLAAKGILSAETQIWSPEVKQWRCFKDLNLGGVSTSYPPLPPKLPANLNSKAQSNGCFSWFGKAVAAWFILGALAVIMGGREKAEPGNAADRIVAEATRTAVGEYKKMDRVLGSGRFTVSMEAEMCDFIVVRIAEILKAPNIDPDLAQWLQRYSQAFARHKTLLQSGAIIMMTAQGSNLERAAAFSEIEAAMKQSDADKWKVINEADALISRIKRRYPQTNFNNL